MNGYQIAWANHVSIKTSKDMANCVLATLADQSGEFRVKEIIIESKSILAKMAMGLEVNTQELDKLQFHDSPPNTTLDSEWKRNMRTYPNFERQWAIGEGIIRLMRLVLHEDLYKDSPSYYNHHVDQALALITLGWNGSQRANLESAVLNYIEDLP